MTSPELERLIDSILRDLRGTRLKLDQLVKGAEKLREKSKKPGRAKLFVIQKQA